LLISPFKSVHKSVRLSHSTQAFYSASSQTRTKKHCVSGFYGFSLLMLCCVVASFSGITLAGDALERPKIGLVLAGGGARGAAHIAVLKYLDAHKIPVDIVTGTSMGAIVGGLYASGLSALAIESLMLEMDWEAALIDDVPRQDRSMQRKFREDRFSVGGTPGFGNGELKFPSGAIQGQNVILALQQMTSHVADIRDFDNLPRPFKAVATDIVSGEMVVLDQGDLAVALRASMGVPAIFAPIEVDGRLLVDGGITNNLPVGLAQEMGAEILIVVDITSPMLAREGLTNLLSITDQLTRLLVVNNTTHQKALLKSTDLLLVPNLEEFSAIAFSDAEAVIKTTETYLNNRSADFDGLKGLRIENPPPMPLHTQTARIDEIRLKNQSGLDDQVLLNRVFTQVGDAFDLDRVAQDVNRIHGLGQFELVSYQFKTIENRALLDIAADGKDWGPNYLHFGFNLESEFKHDSRVSFLLGYSRQQLSPNGAEWISSVSIGDEPGVDTSLYWPFGESGQAYWFADAGYSDQALFDYANNERSSVYALRGLNGGFGIGYEYLGRWRTTFGVRQSKGRALAVSGLETRENLRFRGSSLQWQFTFDTRDDVDFPAYGAIVEAKWDYYFDALDREQPYSQWRFRAGRYFEYQQHNLGMNLHLGSTNSKPNVNNEFRVGGYGLLTGLNSQELRGATMGVLSLIYYQRYNALPALDGLIGATLEYGGAWSKRQEVSAETALGSLGLFIGADTPLGTLQIGFAAAEGGQQNYYARLGRVF
jgi:NTE family protein